MKKKIVIIVCTVVALILCVSLIVSNMSNPKISAAKAPENLSEGFAGDENWEKVDKGNAVIENEMYQLQLDCETTHFTVTHKESGKVYHSVPQKADGFEPTEEQLSEVVITYYDSNSSKASMNSYENSVIGKSYEIKTDGKVIRVYYSIQKSKQKIFVPEVIGQSVYEEEIASNLASGEQRRLKRYYTLYESDNTDADTKEMKNKYPVLADENLYILNESAAEHTYSEITGYMERAEYGQSEYSKELERLGLENSMGEKLPAAFVVPVQYELTDSGLVTTVLTDRITSEADSYKLTDISVLPYFASCGYSENGWFLVPDGSGAIIEFKEKAGITYSQNLWGTDYAVESAVKSNLMQNAGLPVFGFHTGEKAVFSIVTGGTAVAQINAESYGNEFLQSHIYCNFNILAFDSSNMGELSDKASFNLYASDYAEEFPQITYMLFAEAETTYSDMANQYRDYLIKEEILGERLTQKEELPVYVDFTGYETIDESLLGVSTQSKEVLSTLADIQESLKEMNSRGMNGIQIRLKAYGNDGIYGTVSNGFAIDKCVGSEKELQQLANTLDESRGRLYLENNISTVYTTGNSFKKMTHAVRGLKKTVVEGIDFDLVARTKIEAANKFYLTSPAYYSSLIENFESTFTKKTDDTSMYGYSWSDYGSKLWSDFNEAHAYDRTQSVAAMNHAVESVTDTFSKIVTDGSNSYTWKYASAVLNIPLTSSKLSSESFSVPFYQMVVHGYLEYAGAPLNISADAKTTYLATIESGANLYYSYYTTREDALKETKAGTLTYPTYIGTSYEQMESQYHEWSELFKGLGEQLIIRHERLAEEVFITTYEDGTRIAVNYGDKEIEIEGKNIQGNGFALIERGQSSDE